MFIESDDFSDLSNWTTNGSWEDGELVHHIPKFSDDDTAVTSIFNGVHFPGDSAWSISIDYTVNIADISLRGYDPVILSFILEGVNAYERHSISIVGADVGDASGDIRTQLHSNKSSSVGNTAWVFSAPFSGTLTISHDGAGELTFTGAGYTPQVFAGILESTSLLELQLKSSITNDTWDEIKVSFDTLSSTGGVATPNPNPNPNPNPYDGDGEEGSVKVGLGLGAVLGGVSTKGAELTCGLGLSAFMTGGSENVSAKLLASIGIGATMGGDVPFGVKMKAGLCLTCLMRAERIPPSILEAGFLLGAKIGAGQSGSSLINGALFLGCKMSGDTGAGAGIQPCLSREFNHLNWF